MTQVTSRRVERTTGEALEAIAQAEPALARELLWRDCDLVAAFERTAHYNAGPDTWTVFVFATIMGTECVTTFIDVGGFDEVEGWYDDGIRRPFSERTDAWGDAWPSRQEAGYGLFAEPGPVIYPGPAA
jgi:hypothetical protein